MEMEGRRREIEKKEGTIREIRVKKEAKNRRKNEYISKLKEVNRQLKIEVRNVILEGKVKMYENEIKGIEEEERKAVEEIRKIEMEISLINNRRKR